MTDLELIKDLLQRRQIGFIECPGQIAVLDTPASYYFTEKGVEFRFDAAGNLLSVERVGKK